jgi:replicative DNA helicase
MSIKGAKQSVKSTLKIPPQHLDSEMALLGSIMLRPESVHEIVDMVNPEAFYADKHRIIYETMTELMGKNEPIDMLSLSAKLEGKNILENVGGRTYLAELVSIVPSAANIRHYADIVYQKYMLRRLIGAGERIESLG